MRIHSSLIGLAAGLYLLGAAPLAYAGLKVFACEPEWAALAVEIGGDEVTVYSATTALQDPHQVQARPSLIAKARRADLIVCTGAELEVGWLPVLLAKSANPAIQPGKPGHFMATDHVELLDKKAAGSGDLHAAGNPHVHLEPVRLLAIAQALTKTMQSLDAENQDAYQAGLARFQHTWEQAMHRWSQQLEGVKNHTVIVHHDNWKYLLDWAGIKQLATLEPEHGVPPSARHLSQLIHVIGQQNVEMIIRSGYEDERPSTWLSGKTGIPVVTIPFSVQDYKSPGALEKWMDAVVMKLTG